MEKVTLQEETLFDQTMSNFPAKILTISAIGPPYGAKFLPFRQLKPKKLMGFQWKAILWIFTQRLLQVRHPTSTLLKKELNTPLNH